MTIRIQEDMLDYNNNITCNAEQMSNVASHILKYRARELAWSKESLQIKNAKITKENYWLYKLSNKVVQSSQLKTFMV